MATSTADRYRIFGERYARGVSPSYEKLALAIADDASLIERLDRLPKPKRQPNLLFGAVRYLQGPVADPAAFLDWVTAHWTDVTAVMQHRRTQTNEPGRCATLLPLLARLPQPLALLEVGASAGLCLYPDAYRYRYGDHVVGAADSEIELSCTPYGDVPLPDHVPTVAWRAGLDLNPVDLTDDDNLRWLEALIWPEHDDRRNRLRAAASVLRADPPDIRRGDLLTDLPALAAEAPDDATLVIFHSAVLTYVEPASRTAFTRLVADLPGHWVSNEGIDVFPEISSGAHIPPGEEASFVLGLDGRPVALTEQHGRSIRWLSPWAEPAG